MPVPPSTAQATISDTWTRPADGTLIVYVTDGSFQMDSNQEEIDAGLELCQRNSGAASFMPAPP